MGPPVNQQGETILKGKGELVGTRSGRRLGGAGKEQQRRIDGTWNSLEKSQLKKYEK